MVIPLCKTNQPGNLIPARREAEQPFQDHRMSYVFNGLLHSTLARIDRVSRKGWVTQLLSMKRLPSGAFAEEMQVTGTEKGTNVVFLHTTVDDGDHFQQMLAWTLKSLARAEPPAARDYRNLSQRENRVS
jgi:hypothetical protein